MSASELAAAVREALAVDPEEVERRATEEAEQLKEEVQDGTFDNSQALVGLELEFYAANSRTDALRRVPRPLLEHIGFEAELGLHNAEMQTTPLPLNSHGLAAHESEIRAHLAPALETTAAEDIRLVADGVWTVPPVGETATEYLTDSIDQDGIRLATNISDSVRYHTMTNASYPARHRLEAPHVSLQADTVMPESIATSIQPHYQVPHAPDLPTYFGYALRIAGPLLALGVNSPLFPPDLYDDAPAEEILEAAHMENRIHAFESVMNPDPSAAERKVQFPPDFGTVEEIIDDIAADRCIVPAHLDRGSRFDDAFACFRHKHGTYWRWVRPVFEGATRSDANARIEFRPLPAQPTVGDAVAFEAAFAGLMESLTCHEHPVRGLDWDQAETNFYNAVQDGLTAEMRWITAAGEETTDIGTICGECIEYARDGLELRGLSTAEAKRYLQPLQARLDSRMTAARWQHDRVCERVADGVPLTEAIWGVQSEYIDRQAETLLDGSFADWL